MDMCKTMPAAKMVNNGINKIKQFIYECTGVHFFFFSKIDHSAINTISAGSPFIFIKQCPGVLNKIQVLATQKINSCTYSLEKGCDGDRFINGKRDITNAKFYGIKKRMHS